MRKIHQEHVFQQLVRKTEPVIDVLAFGAAVLFAVALFVALRHPEGFAVHHPGVRLSFVVCSGLLLTLLGGLAVIRRLPVNRLWLASCWASAILLTGVVTIWFLQVSDVSRPLAQGTLATSPRSVDAYLTRHMPPGDPVHAVPTGVFIQSMRFTDAYEVKVSGYVWQRYADSLPADLKRGVLVPEAVETHEVVKVYDFRRDGEQVIGWYFEVELRQTFDYRTYPLDEQNVWLRMGHVDFSRRAVLVPDLSAYPPWHPTAAYGLDAAFVPGAWTIKSTSFSYDMLPYSSNFGQSRQYRAESYPELYFNVHMARKFMSPLLGRFIPLSFIAVLIFASLFVTTKDTRRFPLAGFDGLTVVTLAAAVLLVLTVDHNSARQDTGATGVTYIDYIYFCLYAMIMGVVWNSLLLTREHHLTFIQWRDNLAPKLLYWPVLAFLTCAVTAFTFLL